MVRPALQLGEPCTSGYLTGASMNRLRVIFAQRILTRNATRCRYRTGCSEERIGDIYATGVVMLILSLRYTRYYLV